MDEILSLLILYGNWIVVGVSIFVVCLGIWIAARTAKAIEIRHSCCIAVSVVLISHGLLGGIVVGSTLIPKNRVLADTPVSKVGCYFAVTRELEEYAYQ